jgi:hypothetical protein
MGLDRRHLDHGCGLVGICRAVVVQCADGEEHQEDAVDVDAICDPWATGVKSVDLRTERIIPRRQCVLCTLWSLLWAGMGKKLAIISK